MDPLSQGIVGSTAALSGSKKLLAKKYLAVAILGFISGMAADLDVFISSQTDPLLALEHHRGFTHSLFFIPFGGLICAVVLHHFFRNILSFKESLIACTLGYATHGLLDSCTTYGTQLFWPFSNKRVAWNLISIIDPIFTLPLIALVILCCILKQNKTALMASLWIFIYLSFGFLQNQRAVTAIEELARTRGHSISKQQVKPAFGNILLWKTVYEADNKFYIDAVNLAGSPLLYEGQSIEKFNAKRDMPSLNLDSTALKDIERFNWFSNGFIALYTEGHWKCPEVPRREDKYTSCKIRIKADQALSKNGHFTWQEVYKPRKNFIGDIRYSLVPNEINPLWGVKIKEEQDQHVDFISTRELTKRKKEDFFSMLLREKSFK